MDKKALVTDSTILSTYIGCKYKTFLTFVKNKRAIGPTPEPIEKGDLGHKVLECFYLLKKYSQDTGKPFIFKDAVETALQLGREYYPNLSLAAADSEIILDACARNLDHFEHDDWKVIGVEEPFMLKVFENEDVEYYYCGKIDLLIDDPVFGRIPVDHKFRGRKNKETVLNNQFIGYALATNAQMVMVNEVGLQSSLKPAEKYRRIPLPIGDGLKKRWLKHILPWIHEYAASLDHNYWPMSPLPNNCKFCQFEQVCVSESDTDVTLKLDSLYRTEEPWDVTRMLEEKADD